MSGGLLALLLGGCNLPSALNITWNPFKQPEQPPIAADVAVEVAAPAPRPAPPPAPPVPAASQTPLMPLAYSNVTEPNVLAESSPTPSSFSLWGSLTEGMRLPALPLSFDQPRRWLRANGRDIETILGRGQAHLPFILEAVQSRGLPTELALIPAIESGFRPDARSPLGADGLWQFMPATAKAFGLKRTWWYDGRRDLVAATNAAMDYLQALNRRFRGNWLLTVAAYNCGEGSVERALKRAKITVTSADIWTLLPYLPRETRHYVPKLLALAEAVRDPGRFGVTLPSLSLDAQFDQVDTGGQIELRKAADLAGVAPQAIYTLNPGFRRWATDPQGPHRLLVPEGTGNRLKVALASLPAKERVTWQRHQIEPGESLSVIAERYGLRVKDLMVANSLSGTLIRAGAGLLVPRPRHGKPIVTGPIKRRVRAATASGGIYRVRVGDSLWRIARRHNTTVSRLMHLNGLTTRSVLRPGQVLRVT